MAKIEDNILTASRILNILIGGNEVNKQVNREYYEKYDRNNEVCSYLKTICEGLNINLYHYEDGLYISPGANNASFGYSNEMMRTKIFKNYTNPELYLNYFIMTVIITLFYKESDYDTYVNRIRIQDIVKEVDEKIESLKKKDLSELSSKFVYSFEEIVDKWSSLRDIRYKNNNNEVSERGKSSRYSLVKTVCGFLESEGLIKQDENMDTILPQKRFKAIVYEYFQSVGNRNELFEYIGRLSKEDI